MTGDRMISTWWFALAALVFGPAACQGSAMPTASPPAGRAATAPPPAAPAADAPAVPASHRLLVSKEDCDAPAREHISFEDALADFEMVEEILRTGYAGYEILADAAAWDVAFASARVRLKQFEPPLAVETFRSLLLSAFRFTRDGHLAFWTVASDGTWNWGSTGAHADAYVANATVTRRAGKLTLDGHQVLDCSGRDLATLVRPTFADMQPGSLVVELSDKAPEPLDCRVQTATGIAGRTLEFRPLRTTKPPRGEELVSSEVVDGVPILRVRKFDQGKHEEMLALVEAGERLRHEPSFVVDLRGNPGGTDTYARNFFEKLTAGTLRYSTIHELTSTTTIQGTANWATCTLTRPNLDESGRLKFEQMRAESVADLDEMPLGERAWKVYTPQWPGEAPSPYAGSLVALVDRDCGSACETFLLFARQLPGTVVVGENTAGVGVFGEIRRFRLPKSGIWMQAGRKWFQSEGPALEAKEGVGFLPDLWLDAEDPRAAALDIARCLRKTDCTARLRSGLR